MDRCPSWVCRALLSGLAALEITACKSAPVTAAVDPVKAAQDAKCASLTPRRESCIFVGDVMMVITAESLPTYAKKDKHNPRVFSGTCEVIHEGDGAAKPANCEDVSFIATNPALGEVPRSIVITKREFLMGGLPIGQYNVVAKSNAHGTEVELRDTPSGARLKIQIIHTKLIVPVEGAKPE